MTIEFKLPQMSLTMQEGTVVHWVKAEGDTVEKNDVLLEIETDKVTTGLTAPCSGRLEKIMVPENETIPVGTVLCVLDDGSSGKLPDAAPAPAAEQPDAPAAPEHNTAAGKPRAGRRRVSPLAAKIAAKEGIDLQTVTGTGPQGVIVKKDVLDALERAKPAQAPEGLRVKEIPFTGVRKKTAEHMMRSRQMTASLTTFAEADMTQVRGMRQFVHISYTAYAVKAAAMALQQFPYMNASLQGDRILLFEDVNINVAVASDDKLVTPVLQHVERKNLIDVGTELSQLAERGKTGRLTAADFDGGTFTVTNSGVFGSLFFTPIINYPQCAILGIGKLMDQPVARDGQVFIAPMMNLCLTYDHQIVDGATAVRFLQKVKYYLEHPQEMIR